MPFLFLSPSTQEYNAYVNYGTEEFWMNALADAMEAADHSFLCTIENNGVPPSGTLTPGGGLMLMRRLLFPLGGTLEISKFPHFTLTVRIPTPLS